MPLLAIVLAALSLAGDQGHRANPHPDRKCFSARLWSAPDRSRPCAEITRVEEDGSFWALATTAEGRVLYRIGVGNPRR